MFNIGDIVVYQGSIGIVYKIHNTGRMRIEVEFRNKIHRFFTDEGKANNNYQELFALNG